MKVKETDHATAESYTRGFANKHCNGDVEQAKENKIVQIVLGHIEKGALKWRR